MKANEWVVARWVGDKLIAVVEMVLGKGRLTVGQNYETYGYGY